MSNVILVDGDGVMLDYNKAFADCYSKTYNIPLTCVFPRAYTAIKEYGINISNHGSYDQIYKDFEPLNMWRNMPALPGSVEAINSLIDKGYDVRCLTSMPPQYELDRLHNLNMVGFKINKVYAVNRKNAAKNGIKNPKLDIIKQTKALAFIDDLRKNFINCENLNTKMVWLDNEHPLEDNPNIESVDCTIDITVKSLLEFSNLFPQL